MHNSSFLPPRVGAPESRAVRWLLAFLTAGVLGGAALYNNYPLLYPDTGGYVHSGLKLFVPADRPLLYGLFLRLSSLWSSLWLVVLAQALLTGWVLRLTIRCFAPTRRPALATLLLSLGLLGFTGAPFHVGQLIPDCFTPISLLALGLLLWAPGPGLGRIEWGGLGLLYILSLSVHTSHLAIHLLLFGSWVLTGWLPIWWRRRRTAMPSHPVSARRAGVVAGLLALGIGTVPVVHRIYSGHYEFTRATHAFVLNRLVETGILDQYLAETCPTYNWSLCAYQGKIPSDFLWDPNSPLNKSGGVERTAREYSALIRDLLRRPRYLGMYFGKCLVAGGKQAFNFESGGVDAPAQGPGSAGFSAVQEHFPSETREAESARQQIGRLDYHHLNERQQLLVLLGAAVVALGLLTGPPPPVATAGLTRLLLAGLGWNALVCGALSTVVPRYQSRVIWLLPVAALLLAWPRWQAWRREWRQPAEALDG